MKLHFFPKTCQKLVFLRKKEWKKLWNQEKTWASFIKIVKLHIFRTVSRKNINFYIIKIIVKLRLIIIILIKSFGPKTVKMLETWYLDNSCGSQKWNFLSKKKKWDNGQIRASNKGKNHWKDGKKRPCSTWNIWPTKETWKLLSKMNTGIRSQTE